MSGNIPSGQHRYEPTPPQPVSQPQHIPSQSWPQNQYESHGSVPGGQGQSSRSGASSLSTTVTSQSHSANTYGQQQQMSPQQQASLASTPSHGYGPFPQVGGFVGASPQEMGLTGTKIMGGAGHAFIGGSYSMDAANLHGGGTIPSQSEATQPGGAPYQTGSPYQSPKRDPQSGLAHEGVPVTSVGYRYAKGQHQGPFVSDYAYPSQQMYQNVASTTYQPNQAYVGGYQHGIDRSYQNAKAFGTFTSNACVYGQSSQAISTQSQNLSTQSTTIHGQGSNLAVQSSQQQVLLPHSQVSGSQIHSQMTGSQGQMTGSQGQMTGPQGQMTGPQVQGQMTGPQVQGQMTGPQGQMTGSQSQMTGPQGQMTGPQGQMTGTQVQGQMTGTQVQGQMTGPQVQGQMTGPQGQMTGPQVQGQMTGPQGQMTGPQGQMTGPQGQMTGPQGQMTGPQVQGQMTGPQGQMTGPQGQMTGPQVQGQMTGPQGQMTGPQIQGQMTGPQGQMTGTQIQGQMTTQQFLYPQQPQGFHQQPGVGATPHPQSFQKQHQPMKKKQLRGPYNPQQQMGPMLGASLQIASIGLIAAGAYVNIKLDDYNFIGYAYMGPGILLMIAGVINFLLAFFFCCGAAKENYCLTVTFAACLCIIFILEIAGGIAGFVLRDKMENEIKGLLYKSMDKYCTDLGMRDSWKNLQEEFQCCGASNKTDWGNHNITIPDSCCKDKPVCGTYYEQGCANKLESWLQDKIVIIGGVGIGLAFIQVVGIVFACCLARAIKKEYEDPYPSEVPHPYCFGCELRIHFIKWNFSWLTSGRCHLEGDYGLLI